MIGGSRLSEAIVRRVGDLAQRLAARTLELIDIPSESRDEARAAGHVAEVLLAGGVAVRDLGDTCILAGGDDAPVLLAGHLDTVPSQGNRPGRIDGDRVHGLGASDMKGAVAVMLELALAGAPVRCLFFGREELPAHESALAPLLAREPIAAGLVVMMEPTSNELHAGCLGNINATWTFHGRSGHSARPWLADNAIERAAAGVLALAAVDLPPRSFGALEYRQVVSITGIEGGIAKNVIPGEARANVNYRFDPSLSPDEATALLRGWCEPHGSIEVTGCTPGAPPPEDNPLAAALAAASGVPMAPKQAWTPVAELAAAGVDAVNFGPGDPAYAHRADERVAIEALARCHQVLAEVLCA